MSALLRVGTKVRTTDRGARVHGRAPDKPEAIGTVSDHYRPYGRQSKDRAPPYYVTFENGEASWYDASEVEPMRGSTKKSPTQRHHATKKSPAQLQREIDEVLAKPATSRKSRRALARVQSIDALFNKIDEAIAKPVTRAHATRASRKLTPQLTADALFNVDATDPDIAPEVMVALDAFEANRPDAYKLLVGLPATIRIDSDWYAAKVIRATPKTVTAVRIDRGAFPPTVFHLTKRGWRAGPYSLSIGAARTLLGF